MIVDYKLRPLNTVLLSGGSNIPDSRRLSELKSGIISAVALLQFLKSRMLAVADMPTPIIDIETIVSPLFLSVVTR